MKQNDQGSGHRPTRPLSLETFESCGDDTTTAMQLRAAGQAAGHEIAMVGEVYTSASLLHMASVDSLRQRFFEALSGVEYPGCQDMSYVVQQVDVSVIRSALSVLGKVAWVNSERMFYVINEGYVISAIVSHMFGHRELRVVVNSEQSRLDSIITLIRKSLGELVDDCVGSVKVDIGWYYMSGGEIGQRHLTEELRETVHPEAYPYIPDLDKFIRGYLESDSCVLLLMGTQGTGKTRLIRYIAQEAGREREEKLSVIYTSDMRALAEESMFIEFKCSEHEMMILEDIDDLLVSRRNGNPVVHKFLASSDGFIAARHKKIILSTNLFVKDVDEALVRPGRCYACVETRPLEKLEASALAARLGKDMEFDRNMTVAEVYSAVTNGTVDKQYEKKIGFQKR